MKCIQATIFCALVTALLLQSLSLALHPETNASAPARLNPSAQYGSHEPGAEPRAAVTAPATLRQFFWHGLVTGLDAFMVGHSAGGCVTGTAPPARKNKCAHDAPTPTFAVPSGRKPLLRARRAAHTLARRFDAGWHPFSARLGYWTGRLIFAWVAISLAMILTMFFYIPSVYRMRRTHSR